MQKSSSKKMTKSQADKKAQSWRVIASKLYAELCRDRIGSNTRDHLRSAHDALCEAFRSLEHEAGIY